MTARRREDGDPAIPFVPADLASPEGADLAAGQAARILGGLDIVVHGVGASFGKPGGVLALTDDDWAQVLGTNLLAAVRPGCCERPGTPPGCDGLLRPGGGVSSAPEASPG